MSTKGIYGAQPGPYRRLQHEEPAQSGWMQSVLDVLGDLFIPQRPPVKSSYVPPALPQAYSYYGLGRYVVNTLGVCQSNLESNIRHFSTTNEQLVQNIPSDMLEALKLTHDARKWIEKYQVDFRKESPGKIATISLKLKRSDSLLAKLVKQLPLNSLVKEECYVRVSAGLKNSGNDCFMNAVLQGLFGDTVTYKYIAIHDAQPDHIKLHAFNFRVACKKRFFAGPLDIAQDIRNQFLSIKGTAQHGAYDAFTCLIHAFSGKKGERYYKDPFFKDRQEYKKENPLVHKIIRRATYEGIDLNQVQTSDLEAFQNGVHVTEEFTWCLNVPLQMGQRSQAMEALLEHYFNPIEGYRTHFNFHLNSGETEEREAFHEQSVFEKRPEYLFFHLKRVMYQEGLGYYKAPAPFLQETFFLDGKHIETGQGGEYQIRFFVSHTGHIDSKSGKSDGHYVSYRKVGDKWFYASDQEVRPAEIREVRTALMEGCELLFAGRVDTPITQEEISRKVQEKIVSAKVATINIFHGRDVSDTEFYPHSKLIPRVEAMRLSIRGVRGAEALVADYRTILADKRTRAIEISLEKSLSSATHCFKVGHQDYDENFQIFYQQWLVSIQGQETLLEEAWKYVLLKPLEEEFSDIEETVKSISPKGEYFFKKVPTKILKEELQILVERSQSLFLNFLNERNLKLNYSSKESIEGLIKRYRHNCFHIFRDLIALEWLKQDKARLRRFIENKKLPESALCKLPLFKTHFDFKGSHYVLKNTLVDGASALHALLGEEIHGEVRFSGDRATASSRVRRHFTDALTESLNTRPAVRAYLLKALATYLNRGDASADILAPSVSEGSRLKREWVAIQKRYELRIEVLQKKAIELWLPWVQASHSPVLEKILEKAQGVVVGSRQEIVTQLRRNPIQALDIIAQSLGEFLALLPDQEKRAVTYIFKALAEVSSQREEEQEKFIFSGVYKYYVKKLNDPSFYYNTIELQLAAYLFNKKVLLIQPTGDLPIHPEQGGDPLLIHQAGIYFSRCVYDGHSVKNPVDPETGRSLQELQIANHYYALALVEQEKEKEKFFRQLFEEACKEEAVQMGLTGGISLCMWNPYLLGSQAVKSSVRLGTIYFDPLQESPLSEGVNMLALPAFQIATGSPAPIIVKSLCVDVAAKGVFYYGRHYLEDHLEKVGFSTQQIEKMKELYHKTPVAVRPFLMSTVKYILFRNSKDLHSGYVSGAFAQANHYFNPESPDPEIRLAQATWTSRTIKVICTNDALQEWIVNKLVEKFSSSAKELTEQELAWKALREKFPELEDLTDLEFKEFLDTINRLLKDNSHLMDCPEPPPNSEELQEGKKEDKYKQYVERSITIKTEDGPKKLKSRLPTRKLAYEMRELYRQMVNNPYQANLLLYKLQQKALEAGVPFWEIPGALDFQNTYFQVNGSKGNEIKVYENGQLVEIFKGKNAGKKAIEYVKQRMEGLNTDRNNFISNYEMEIEALILKYSGSDLPSYSPLHPLSPEQFLMTISDARRKDLINIAKDKVDQRLSPHLMSCPEPLSYYYISEPVYKKNYYSEKRFNSEKNIDRIKIYRIEKTDSGEEVRTHIADAPNQDIADEILLLLKDHDSNFNAANLRAYELQQKLKALGISPTDIFAFPELTHTYYDFNNTQGTGAAKVYKDGEQIYYSKAFLKSDRKNEGEGALEFLRNSINQDKDHFDQLVDAYEERLKALTPPHIMPPSLSGIVDVERLSSGECAIYIIDSQGRRIAVNRLEGWDMTCFKEALSNFIANKFSLEIQVHEAIKNLIDQGISLEDIPNLPQLEEATSQNSSHWATKKKNQQNTELVENYLALLKELFPDQYIPPSQLTEREKQELVNRLNPYVPHLKEPKEHGFWFETWRNIKDGLDLMGKTGLMQGSINIPIGPTSTSSGGSSYVERSYGRTSSTDYYPPLSHTGTHSDYNYPITVVPDQNILDLNNIPQTHPFLPPPLSFDNPSTHTYNWEDNVAFHQTTFLQTQAPDTIPALYLDLQGRSPNLTAFSPSSLTPERVSPQLRPWVVAFSNVDRVQQSARMLGNQDLVTSLPRGVVRTCISALKLLVPNMADFPNVENPHAHLDRIQGKIEQGFDEFAPVHNPNSIAATAGGLLGQAIALGPLYKVMHLARGPGIFYSVVEGGVMGAVVTQADHQSPLKGAVIGGAVGGGLYKIAGLFFIPKGNISSLSGRALPLRLGKTLGYSSGGVLGLTMDSDMNAPYPGIRGIPQEMMHRFERDLRYVVSYTARMALEDLISCKPSARFGVHVYRALKNVVLENRISPPIPHSEVYTIEGKVHSDVVLISMNGINTSVSEALYNARVISEKLNGYQVHALYNSSHGLVGDLIDFGYEKCGGKTNIVNLTYKQLKKALDAGKRVVIIAHSEGNVIARNAYMLLTPQERKKVEVHGLAVTEVHPKQQLGDARNYISKNDWVAMMANPGNCIKAAIDGPGHVEFLEPNSWNPLAEHSFMGETNQKVLKKSCDDIIDRYGLKDE